ncbi:hypothetical protein RB195_013536 [Necator americanus]|uniref:Uncharacterized protein n=1 Tax=Necator americanus TaxID=51031 RepID=A0ABR1DVY6_NECAM
MDQRLRHQFRIVTAPIVGSKRPEDQRSCVGGWSRTGAVKLATGIEVESSQTVGMSDLSKALPRFYQLAPLASH